MQLHKHYLAILLSASLTGCLSGGGSFDVEEVGPTKVINNPADKKVTYKQAEKPNPEDFSEMGATFNSPIPLNLLLLGETGKLYTVNPEEQYVHIDENYDQLTIRYPAKENGKKVIKEEKINIAIKPDEKNGKWDYLTEKGKTQYDVIEIKHNQKLVGKYYADSSFEEARLKLFTFDNTKVGIVRIKNPTYDNFWISSIFYRGKDKTTDVPISGTLTYKGYWAFATQLATNDYEKTMGGNGQDLTIYTYTADFKADFSTKQLTGELKGSDEDFNFDYKINANIKGNGFTGNATGEYEYKFNREKYKSPATVSGSFFGTGAAELAGKAIADDNAWAGVFAAKKENNSGTDIKTDGDLFQAGVMTFTAVPSSLTSDAKPASIENSSASNSQSTTYQLNQYQKVNYSGNIEKLQVDGMLIDLTQNPELNKPCCSAKEDEENGLTTQSVKFGKYGYTKQAQNGSNTSNEDNKVGGYFVQGVLTPTSQVPMTGTSQYDGRWYGYASSDKGVFSGEALDAKFTAKWQEKQLEGKLFNQNQVDEASLNFKANITGNSFNATNSTLKIATDTSKDSENSTKITIDNIKVEGHFYGKGANELGGHFYSEDKKAGGVFGAKQIETQSK
ncbi:transferrin-binding protein-like solute binding protein [Mergibacter septicus]|uniref:transferrin-binding protein-like solute binding protein n=1 Tax=Mergibacter septicus TaxID=221402 RepID=UPI0028119152|nr:transferrin-binding protein-like solute binding protein [Mergibacter septicus]WMR95413.1 transferrin-binding protein-like solute binding protein [Mergibacter septicus]